MEITEREASALIWYISQHGIPYGPDGGIIEGLLNRLTAPPATPPPEKL